MGEVVPPGRDDGHALSGLATHAQLAKRRGLTPNMVTSFADGRGTAVRALRGEQSTDLKQARAA